MELAEYDPDAPLLDRLRTIAELEDVELHVQGHHGVTEIVGSPQHHTESKRRFWLACGRKSDDWQWEIVVPKKDGLACELREVNPMQELVAYEATKRTVLRDLDIRIYGVDTDRLGEEGE